MGFCCTLEQEKKWRARADREGYLEVFNEGDRVILLTEAGNRYSYSLNGRERKV